MIFRISTQKYTEKSIHHRKIILDEISPVGDPRVKLMRKTSEGEYRWNFDDNYFCMKTMLFDSVCYAEHEYGIGFFILTRFQRRILEILLIFSQNQRFDGSVCVHEVSSPHVSSAVMSASCS